MVPGTVSRRILVCSLSAILLLTCFSSCGAPSTKQANFNGQNPSSPPEALSSTSDPQAVRVAGRVEGQQRANFALLRTPPEGLPTAVQRALGNPVFGSNWNLAQRIPTIASGAYWLLPGNGYMCVVSERSLGSNTINTTCARASQARQRGIAAVTVTREVPGSQSKAARLIVGLAPDGARQVVVHTRGIAETVRVHHEVFVLNDVIAAPPDFLTPR